MVLPALLKSPFSVARRARHICTMETIFNKTIDKYSDKYYSKYTPELWGLLRCRQGQKNRVADPEEGNTTRKLQKLTMLFQKLGNIL
jgi:hypothetical protein